MIRRTKADVERYLLDALPWLFKSALADKNAAKGAPEHEEISFLAKKLGEEVGEVTEALIERDYERAQEEIGDVLWTATMLAVRISREEDAKSFDIERTR